MKFDSKYYFDYTPKDIKSAHALIRRLRQKLIQERMEILNLKAMLPAGYKYKTYPTQTLFAHREE